MMPVIASRTAIEPGGFSQRAGTCIHATSRSLVVFTEGLAHYLRLHSVQKVQWDSITTVPLPSGVVNISVLFHGEQDACVVYIDPDTHMFHEKITSNGCVVGWGFSKLMDAHAQFHR